MSDSGLYKNQPMSKSQPNRASEPAHGDMSGRKNTSGNYLGDGKDFNYKGKVKSNEGSDYHDNGRPSSGLYGNFKEKDASIAYLKERGMKGQEIRHFNATTLHSKMHTGNGGVTAYNSNPIHEAYGPATSHKSVPSEAVIRPRIQKEENPELKSQHLETKKLKK